MDAQREDLKGKKMVPQNKSGVSDEDRSLSDSHHMSEKLSGVEICRICQCLELDKQGDSALEFLGIDPPLRRARKTDGDMKLAEKVNAKEAESFVESISPDGQVLVCKDDLEMGLYGHEDALIELGCSCKNDLALVHYACALKWFVNHGSTVCEVCHHVAKNISTTDFTKVMVALEEYELLMERTAHNHTSTSVDSDGRQGLSEISLWFGLHDNCSNNDDIAVFEAVSESSLNTETEEDSDTTEEVSSSTAVLERLDRILSGQETLKLQSQEINEMLEMIIALISKDTTIMNNAKQSDQRLEATEEASTQVQRNMPSSSDNSSLTTASARMDRILSNQNVIELLTQETNQKVDMILDLLAKNPKIANNAKQSDQHLDTTEEVSTQAQRNMPSSSNNSSLTTVSARLERISSSQDAFERQSQEIGQKVKMILAMVKKMKTVANSVKQSDQHLETPTSIQDQPQGLITEGDQRTTPERQNMAQQAREAQMMKEHTAEDNQETEHLDIASKQESKNQPNPLKRKKKFDGTAGEQSEDDPQDAFGEEGSNVATVQSQDGKKPIQTYMSRRKRDRKI